MMSRFSKSFLFTILAFFVSTPGNAQEPQRELSLKESCQAILIREASFAPVNNSIPLVEECAKAAKEEAGKPSSPKPDFHGFGPLE